MLSIAQHAHNSIVDNVLPYVFQIEERPPIVLLVAGLRKEVQKLIEEVTLLFMHDVNHKFML